jgi:branched-chain amino acid transport system ATP-binding protein
MSDPVLSIEGLAAGYDGAPVVRDLDLTVGVGEVVALLGPNGAGKTTTLRSILGLTPARRGCIRFADCNITHWPTHRIARSGISWVPDDRRVFPTLTVERNLSIAVKRTAYRSWNQKEVSEIFPALDYLRWRECENLSGGEMQMVAIARALLGAPGLVLFDEPSQGLAPKIVDDVLATIRRLKREGVSVLLVEQNCDLALSVADRVYVLDQGVVGYEGPAVELQRDAAHRHQLLGI